MADVAGKQQTTALFLSTIVTRTRRHTEITNKQTKTDKPDEKPVVCQRTFRSVFRAVFYTVKLHRLEGTGPLKRQLLPCKFTFLIPLCVFSLFRAC